MSVEPVIEQRPGASVAAWVTFRAARMLLRPLMTCWPLTSWGLAPLPLIDTAAELLPALRGTQREAVALPGCRAEWVRAAGVSEDGEGAVLYFHGGAFLACGVATHRREVTRISAATGLPVLSVGYRQLPKVGLSGSAEDCLAAYQWLLAEGFDPARIVFAGDSAGGLLAFWTALAARDSGVPVPGGIVALSPLLELDPATVYPNAARDAYAPIFRQPLLLRLLDVADPELSPARQNLAGLPPVLIITAESEALRCDAELMAERLSAADVPCELQVWEGQVHAFPVLGNLLPESRAAIAEIGRFVRGLIEIADDGDLTALAG